MAEEESKSADHINLCVKSQDGSQIYFKVRRTTPFQKLFTAYCQKQGQDLGAVAFLFDGTRLRAESTPAAEEMEDEDVIDVVLHQIGGMASCSQEM